MFEIRHLRLPPLDSSENFPVAKTFSEFWDIK